MCGRTCISHASLFALAIASSPLLDAQIADAPAVAVVSGVVRDRVDRGVSGTQVQVAGSDQRTVSDSAGRFTLRGVPTGTWELVLRRIGYRPLVWTLTVPRDGVIDVVIRLEPFAQSLAPVLVRGREALRGNAAAFYARRQEGRGRFLTADDIRRRQLWTMRDVMRTIPGSRVTRIRGREIFLLRGANTPPVVYLDGVRMAAGEADLNLLDPRSFLGVEVYSGPATTPPQFAMSDLSGRSGGVIVVWTREGGALPRRARRGDSSPAETVAQLVANEDVLTADAVDQPARLDNAFPVQPLFPDSLLDAGIAGSATLEFVVNADGQLRLETLSVVSATHPAFGISARDAVLAARFVAAVHKNRNVAQVVMLTVEFEPTP
jgi:TonB family protein